MHKVVNNQMSFVMENSFLTTSALTEVIAAIFFIAFHLLVVWPAEPTYNF